MLRGLLLVEPEVTDKEDAVELPSIEGHVVLEDVTFGYDPDVPVLRNVTLEVPPGETFALSEQPGPEVDSWRCVQPPPA